MKKLLLLLVFVALFFVLKVTGLTSYLSFDVLKASQASLQAQFSENPVLFVSSFFGVYVLATAFSLPGATILTLAGGAIFGLWQGFVIVSFASSLGATLAFLVTRYVLRDSVEKKFKTQLQGINEGIKREGSFYLFTLRLVPLFPFFLINMLMGLTQMRVWVFYIVSQVGMILGTLVYVNAGTQLAQLDSGAGILTPKLILSFVLLGIFPLLSKKLIDALKARKVYRGFKKPDRFDYNLVAIGAGAAGLVTTYIGAAVKAKVALIEKHKMGGDCLNTGCVPSKALIKSAKLAQQIKQSEKYGLKTSQSTVDFKQVIQRVHKVIEEIAPHDSIERYTGLGVECLTGEAEILSPWEVKVGDRVLRTKNIVLATGAGPLIPPIPGLREIKPLSSENLWEITSLPQRLLVLGGGPIGCELSQAFSRLGSQVTQVEVQESLLVREDSDVSKLVTEKFKAEGINLLLGHKAESFGQDESGKFAQLKNAQGVVKVYFDEVIVALGRKANTNMKGLERLGLELNPSGTFAHDEYLRTKYPNVFVCGDCAGPYQFTHVAAHQAWYASVNALFSPFKMFKADYRVIPWTTFTDPEVARVGLSEKEASEKGIEVEVTRYGIDDLDRAIADGENHGFVKVLTPKGSDKILGATIVGAHAGELLAEFVLAMKWNLGLNKILGTIHAYPTFSEANKYLAGEWKRAHKPEGLLKWVERFHRWRRG